MSKLISREYFTADQRERISTAVKKAEANTSGEIVPVLATASDKYERGLFLAAITFAVITTLAILALFFLPIWPAAIWSMNWAPVPLPLIALVVLQFAALVIGYRLAARVAGVHRALIPHALMQRRVDQAAHRAFHQFRLTHTEAATGIMIYVSLFERMVVVVADQAIGNRHKVESWQHVRDLLLDGIKAGNAEKGFIDAIAECGRILAEDFPIQPDDTNELSNELRLV